MLSAAIFNIFATFDIFDAWDGSPGPSVQFSIRKAPASEIFAIFATFKQANEFRARIHRSWQHPPRMR